MPLISGLPRGLSSPWRFSPGGVVRARAWVIGFCLGVRRWRSAARDGVNRAATKVLPRFGDVLAPIVLAWRERCAPAG
jgi:hypothetical protein